MTAPHNAEPGTHAAAAATATVAAITHQGHVRERNEDCIAVGDWIQADPMQAPRVSRHALAPPLVCLTLDGMGGHPHGEVAARLAAEFLARVLPECDSDAALAEGMNAAHTMLHARMGENRRYRGMGTTVAGIRVSARGVQVFNVGDSRVYRHQDGSLLQLSIDDVYLPAGWQGRTSLITQSLGGSYEFVPIVPHAWTCGAAAPGTYLLCSDGLFDRLDDQALARAFDADPGASAQRLMALALEAGARDNVSIVVVKLE